MKAKRKVLKPISGTLTLMPAIRCRDGSVWVLVKFSRALEGKPRKPK